MDASRVNPVPANLPAWAAALPQILADLSTSPKGLGQTEASERLRRYGRNILQGHAQTGFLQKLARRVRNPLMLVLLAAAGASAATGDVTSASIIVVIVLLGLVLDHVQEYRAEQAAEQLKQSVALNERVLRDGAVVEILADAIVPGDVVLLAAGDLVPADGRLLEARDFFVNEALLTGESYPREKHASEAAQPSRDEAAGFAAFMGTSVVSGSAKLLIVTTGRNTELGQIADSLHTEAPPAPLERGIHEFGLLIVRVTALMASLTFLINIFVGRPLLPSSLFALALAVGLTPELLPMIVSVTLAQGALRMARQRVIVKRLAAIHDLGSMDILCTDKTGTLTEARIEVVKAVALTGVADARVLELAWLNSHFETGLRSPLDTAILAAIGGTPANWVKVDEVPFGFDRRRVSVLLEQAGERVLIVKGAPEDILRLTDRYDGATGEPQPFDAAAHDRAQQLFEAMSREGYRLLAIARRQMPAQAMKAGVDDEVALIFSGFVAFMDPPKEGVLQALGRLRDLGVQTKIVTGDNELVARHVCQQIGFPVADCLSGAEMELLGDDALLARVEMVNLFCRVTPAQKNRIILALQRRGHSVGYLGDGINDAPSLHTADIGISVEGAVDVAKDAADLILLDKDIGAVAAGVREGRRTFGNIMKYIMMGTSSNFGNMVSMIGASLLLPFLPMLPIQILLNNLLYDLSQIAIPFDHVDEEMLARPRKWDMRFIQRFMLTLGPISSLFDFLTFGLLYWVFGAIQGEFQAAWFIESLASQVLVIFVIRTRRNPLADRPHPYLAITAIAMASFGIVLPFTPVGAWFGFVAPSPGIFMAMLGLTVCYLFLAEGMKRLFFRYVVRAGLAS